MNSVFYNEVIQANCEFITTSCEGLLSYRNLLSPTVHFRKMLSFAKANSTSVADGFQSAFTSEPPQSRFNPLQLQLHSPAFDTSIGCLSDDCGTRPTNLDPPLHQHHPPIPLKPKPRGRRGSSTIPVTCHSL